MAGAGSFAPPRATGRLASGEILLAAGSGDFSPDFTSDFRVGNYSGFSVPVLRGSLGVYPFRDISGVGRLAPPTMFSLLLPLSRLLPARPTLRGQLEALPLAGAWQPRPVGTAHLAVGVRLGAGTGRADFSADFSADFGTQLQGVAFAAPVARGVLRLQASNATTLAGAGHAPRPAMSGRIASRQRANLAPPRMRGQLGSSVGTTVLVANTGDFSPEFSLDFTVGGYPRFAAPVAAGVMRYSAPTGFARPVMTASLTLGTVLHTGSVSDFSADFGADFAHARPPSFAPPRVTATLGTLFTVTGKARQLRPVGVAALGVGAVLAGAGRFVRPAMAAQFSRSTVLAGAGRFVRPRGFAALSNSNSALALPSGSLAGLAGFAPPAMQATVLLGYAAQGAGRIAPPTALASLQDGAWIRAAAASFAPPHLAGQLARGARLAGAGSFARPALSASLRQVGQILHGAGSFAPPSLRVATRAYSANTKLIWAGLAQFRRPTVAARLSYAPPPVTFASDLLPATVISQYRNSPVLLGVLARAAAAVDPAYDIEAFYRLIWNVDTAQGYGLDVWGRIVGVTRVLRVASADFFGFRQASPGATGFGQGPFYIGQPLTGNYNLADADFRTLIYAKALANVSDGSIPSINAILRTLFAGRGNAYVQDTGGMTMRYVFDFSLTFVEQAIIGQSGVLPSPSGVTVTVAQS